MIKKIFTLSLIASILLCNTLNSLEFKIKNNSKKPVFFRIFEKKNGQPNPPLNNFTLLTLDSGKEKTYTFERLFFVGISSIDPASTDDELDTKLFRVTQGKNIDMEIDKEDRISFNLEKGSNKNDFLRALVKIQKNEKGKWKVLEEYLPKPKEKFIIQKPVIELRPSPQPVKIIEQPLSPQTIKVIE